jgi:pyruvate,water dikinase
MTYLVDFEDERALQPDIVGHKFVSLAMAQRSGFAVPAAVALSTEAHRYYRTNRRWPEGLLEEVLATARALDLSKGLSIRSSGTQEDLERQSYAGQYRSFLRVLQEKDLLESIEQCWLSAETEGVRSYQRSVPSAAKPPAEPLMGVILQKMVPAVAAGVAFSRNPLNPVRDEVVIEAVAGSPESLVSGHVTPYRAFIDAAGRLRLEPPPENAAVNAQKAVPPLKPDQWSRIADLIRNLEKAIHKPSLDVEWTVDAKNRLWLLQYRKITTLADSDPSIPPGIWTRKIANDLWADRLTPFLAQEMLRNAPRFNFSRTFKIVGIPVPEPTLAVIQGFLYINCKSVETLISHLPPKFRTADMRVLFPDLYDFEAIPAPGLLRLLATLTRGLLLTVLDPEVNPLICLWRSRHHQKAVEKRLKAIQRRPDETTAQTLAKTAQALEAMARIQVTNQWPYFYATFFTLLLRWLMVDIFGRSHADFLERISTGGDNVTIDIERRFRQMGRAISRDPDFAERFVGARPEALFEQLPAWFRTEFAQFLKHYGCRSRHRTLYIARWAEAPAEILRILKSLVKCQTTVQAMAGSETDDTAPVGGTVSGSSDNRHGRASHPGPRSLRLLLWFLLPLARKFLDLRENLRFLLDKVLYEIRQDMLILGQHTGLGQHILFLKRNEIRSLVDGSLTREAALAVAAERYHRFMAPAVAHDYYVDGQPIEAFTMSADVIRGIGTSPGRATGRARIVSDPGTAEIEKGDILVAENTDPGWTPILSMAGGMIMEEGGLLNHCSIVARELEIPAVVGVRQATRRIKAGDRVTIDGGLGLVRIEAQSQRISRGRQGAKK